MIYAALYCVAQEMNEFYKAKLGVADDRVILSGIINQDGSLAIPGENKVVITLLNVEKELLNKNAPIQVTSKLPQGYVNINLHILFSAYFPGSNYPEALKFLSYTIAFLQQKNVFTKSNTPALDEGIDKLVFELENMSTEKQSNLWTTLGAKYMPSVLYKMRTLTFNNNTIAEVRPPVLGISQ